MIRLLFILFFISAFGQKDASDYIQQSINYKGKFIENDTFYTTKPIVINKNFQEIRNAVIWSDKPINLIEITSNKSIELQRIKIVNVTLIHKGSEKGDYSAIYFGGNGQAFWLKKGELHFDYYGNRIGNAVTVDFENMRWASDFSTWDISGYWQNVNVGFKAIKKEPYKHQNGKTYNDVLNTINLKVKIWGANSYYQIDSIDNSTIDLLGQYLYDSDQPIFYIKAHSIVIDQMIYDVNQKRPRGMIGAENLTLTGKSTMFGDGYYKLRAMTYSTIEAKNLIVK